ncbi:DUF881 domain-containing protein [Pseudomonadota bacterium]
MKFKSFDLPTKVTFITTGILIGLLLTLQIRSAIPASTFITDEITVQKELIKSYMDDQSLLKSRIVSLREEIEENQEKTRLITQTNNLETLKELKTDIGLEVAKGPGISITLDDGFFGDRSSEENVSQSLIHASDLRDLINVLRTANAEAIAINDQRIIASTSVTSVGNTILVNNFHLLPPFTISAIGDQDILERRLNDENSMLDLRKRIKDNSIQFSAKRIGHLIAPIYNGNFSLKFISEAQKDAQ